MTIKTQLLSLFVGLALFTALGAVAATVALVEFTQTIEHVYRGVAPELASAKTMAGALDSIRMVLEDTQCAPTKPGDATNLVALHGAPGTVAARSQPSINRFLQAHAAALAASSAGLPQVDGANVGPATPSIALLHRMPLLMERLQSHLTIHEERLNGPATQAPIYRNIFLPPQLTELEELVAQYDRLCSEELRIDRNASLAVIAKARLMAAVTIGIVFLGSLAAALFATRRISRPLQRLEQRVRIIAQGDLSVRPTLQRKDELGGLAQSINDMAVNLRATTVSKDYVDSIIRSLADGLLVVDTHSGIKLANQAAAQITGHTVDELVGQRVDHLIRDETALSPGFFSIWLERNVGAPPREYQCTHASGHPIPVLISIARLETDHTGEEAFVFTLRDISALKASEAEMARLHDELLRKENARLAGMAEVATGVLHNVGNVLNSANVSAQLLHERVEKSELRTLDKTAGLLWEHREDLADYLARDPKGRLLPDFLVKLSAQLQAERQVWKQELEALSGNIAHIKEIVAMQQDYTNVFGVTEIIAPAELVREALHMTKAAWLPPGIEVVQELDPNVPVLRIDRHTVLQILINLIQNAVHAMANPGLAERRLVVRVSATPPPERAKVRMSFRDTGVGIAPDDIVKIFGHGFTTKHDGHGFGLHNGANAAKALGGSLTCHSKGLGQGAEFTLELPVAPPDAKPGACITPKDAQSTDRFTAQSSLS